MKITPKRLIKSAAAILAALIVCTGLYAAERFNLIPKRTYSAEHFGIETVTSKTDYNRNGADDYTDLVLGARKDAKNHPKYDGTYQDGGFPPDNIGVCTDVVWRAFRNAGYNLREMVDKDITARPEAYTKITVRDKNIDFRRVTNLRIFFEKYAVSLSTDPSDISQWQPGDIIIFENDKHIGIVSDKRNAKGQPYIIHNGGQPNREEDAIEHAPVTGHYRFDASRVDKKMLVRWE